MVASHVAERAPWTRAQVGVVGASVCAGVVARWWALGARGLTFDEAFTAVYSRVALGELPTALRVADSHPPLDYLLRRPFSGSGSEWLLRTPSALMSTAALAVFVLWMRRRGWFGALAVALFALSPFQLLHGREARMYALMTLVGVGVAVLAARWLEGDRRPVLTVATGALVLVACLDHAGGLFLAVGVLAVPGLSRDRDAWQWRAAPVVAVLVWAVAWGPIFLDQAASPATWVPYTSIDALSSSIGGVASFLSGSGGLATGLIVAGAVCTWALDRRLGRLVLRLAALPTALVAIVGLDHHVLLSRTFAAWSWAVPVALAALVVWLHGRRAVLGLAVLVVVAVLTLRSLPRAVVHDERTSAAAAAGVASVATGDGLFVHPAWWWPLAAWNGADGDRDGVAPPAGLEGRDGWYWVRPGGADTGRTWVLHPASYRFDTTPWPSCAPSRELEDGWVLDCVVTGGS